MVSVSDSYKHSVVSKWPTFLCIQSFYFLLPVCSCVSDAKDEDEMEYRVWNQYHSEDIYSMHAHSSKMLVTASYSGDIIVWNIDSGQAFCRFNASESPLPLIPIRVRLVCQSLHLYWDQTTFILET